jgi:hypothetical protein
MDTTREQRTGSSADADDVLVPVSLELAPIRGLMIIDLNDDPTYRTLEPQLLDGPGGVGLVLLAYRHDEHVELYAEPDLPVDPSGYGGLGRGLLGIHRTTFDAARFEVTATGLELDIAFAAPDGRRIELHIHEHLEDGRDRIGLLAPVGGTFDIPEFFPFLWLPAMSFVPVRDSEVVVRVDGRRRTVTRLPLPLGGRRCLMARYDLDVMVCQLNPSWAADPRRPSAPAAGEPPEDGSDVVLVDGHHATAGLQVRRGAHRCAVRFDPPLPDPRDLPPSAHLEGVVELRADGSTELQGRYGIGRTGDRVTLTIDRIGPWRTRQRRPLLAVLFRLPLFRRWPTTYRWRATLDLTAPTGDGWSSRWSRSA